MAFKTLETIKVRYCPHACAEVGLQAQVVYPAEWMPDQPPRVMGHCCSHALLCNQENRSSCVWAGTNPLYDPFLEA
jgi:hypothetical protein